MPGSSKPIEETKLVNAEQVAQLLEISVRGVWRHVSAGAMPKPIYIGRLARWRLTAVQDWINNGCPRCGDHA